MKASLITIFALVAVVSSAAANAQDNGWTGATGNWFDTTWEAGSPPDATFDSRGIIGSNAGSNSPVGAVVVTSNVAIPASALVLGDGLGTDGTLNIAAGGNLPTATDSRTGSSGDLSVGAGGGVGTLQVSGTLDVAGELESRNTADSASTIRLSDGANVTSRSGFMDRQFIVDGSNVNYAVTNDLVLGSSGVHTWRIPSTGAATISVGGNVDLGGTLKLEFPDGTPALGSAWNLVDSATVDQNESPATGFTSIDQSAVTGLDPGTNFTVKAAADAGSSHGVFTRVTLEQHPVLVVNRQTGSMQIQNFSGSTPTEMFDAYVVGSGGGNLDSSGWSSFAPSSGWQEAAATNNALSELNPIGADFLSATEVRPLGTTFQAPNSFGDVTDDITFRFAKPDQPTFTEGTVVYTGPSNSTLTLAVDPVSGAAQLMNATAFSVTIDTYAITSASNSLNPSWTSLDDQGLSGGNWHEANVSAGQLSELLAVGGMTLAPGAIVSLGSAYTEASGERDLIFEFAQFGDESGDFNGDGIRDGADFLLWQRGESLDSGSAADLGAWEAGYGLPASPGGDYQTGTVLYGPLAVPSRSAGAPVPEPAAATTLIALAALWGVWQRGN